MRWLGRWFGRWLGRWLGAIAAFLENLRALPKSAGAAVMRATAREHPRLQKLQQPVPRPAYVYDTSAARPHRRRYWIALAAATILLALIALPAGILVWTLYDLGFPSAAAVTSQRAIVLQAADGAPLPHQGTFRLPAVPMRDMPDNVVNAVLSIEDRYFYQHGAIDIPSTLRALVQNFKAGHVVAGGSTITQQLVKLGYLGPQRTYHRKIQEAAIGFWLEYELGKDQILSSYLNNVYLGAGAVGFPAAAQRYFGKDVGALTLSEAAMLAGLINAPSQDDPLINLAAARSRAAIVIDAMAANGKLSAQAALVAKLHPATPRPTPTGPTSSGWFADWVYDKVATATPVTAGAIRVRTTLDPHLQNLASDTVNSVLAEYGADKHATQAALVAMQPDGAVVAMVGGRSYAASAFNRAVQAKRQPGSAFKVFDYYAALRQGLHPGDEILDEPVDIKGWEPRNYGRRYHGQVTLADAFTHSLNAATVRLAQQVGIDGVIAAARDLGLHSPLPNEPSIALGASVVTLLDLTSTYAAIRAGVTPVEPWGIASVQMPDQTQYQPVGRSDEPQHSLGAYQSEMIDLLQGVVEHGTGRAAALPGLAAGKTGTTQDYRDAWFIGFYNSLIVGVWVGNDDHSPMLGVAGGSIPAMIWKKFMQQAPTGKTFVAQQLQTAPPDAPTSGAAGEQTPAPNRLVDQDSTPATPGTVSAKCNI
ncbi:MAG TPA: PBP1A family penicillin-binding protein, partial [Xanthobacteraceae bacterium]|nr:PBP1A family penicillin-binding protein [Xanthobacteraceae bacterium]